MRVDAWLDAIGGTEFLAELHRIEKEMFEADWAEARARVGDRATAADLRRTAVQRRADAMVALGSGLTLLALARLERGDLQSTRRPVILLESPTTTSKEIR